MDGSVDIGEVALYEAFENRYMRNEHRFGEPINAAKRHAALAPPSEI